MNISNISNNPSITVEYRIKTGLKGIGYALIAIASAYSTFESFKKGKCSMHKFAGFPFPNCNGGIGSTTLFSLVLPPLSCMATQMAIESFKETFSY